MPLEIEFEEKPKIKVEVDKETLKEILEKNPDKEAVEACMAGVWADRWAEAVTGLTKEEAAARDLTEMRENVKRRLCTRLVRALYES